MSKKFKLWTEEERDIIEQEYPMGMSKLDKDRIWSKTLIGSIGRKGETTRQRYERKQIRIEERIEKDARKNGPTIQEEF